MKPSSTGCRHIPPDQVPLALSRTAVIPLLATVSMNGLLLWHDLLASLKITIGETMRARFRFLVFPLTMLAVASIYRDLDCLKAELEMERATS